MKGLCVGHARAWSPASEFRAFAFSLVVASLHKRIKSQPINPKSEDSLGLGSMGKSQLPVYWYSYIKGFFAKGEAKRKGHRQSLPALISHPGPQPSWTAQHRRRRALKRLLHQGGSNAKWIFKARSKKRMERYSKSRSQGRWGVFQTLKKSKKRIIMQCDQRLRNVNIKYESNIKNIQNMNRTLKQIWKPALIKEPDEKATEARGSREQNGSR